MKAYLSGAMENAKNEGAEWRELMTKWLKNNLGHDVFNPVLESKKLEEKYNDKNYRERKNSQSREYKKFIREIINQDLVAVTRDVDYLLVIWDDAVMKGGGTHGEVTIAYWFNVPIYLVNLLSNKKDLSSWISSCSTAVYNSLDELKLDLRNIYSK